jgi:hypothetical protein
MTVGDEAEPRKKEIIWSALGQEICHVAATEVHAVHQILPGPGKGFWPL